MWRERITWCGPLPILWTRSSSLAARSGTPLPTLQRLCQVQEDMSFVQNFTLPDFQAKTFTPLILPNFNSFSDKNTKI